MATGAAKKVSSLLALAGIALEFAALKREDDKEGKPRTWIQVALQGRWLTHQSGPFAIDESVYRQLLANHARNEMERVVDYEHQTLHGVIAPAAGWIEGLEVRESTLWALVRWTPDAWAHIAKGEYRYVSPVIYWHAYDARTYEDMGAWLHSVALTNDPYLDGLKPIDMEMDGSSMRLMVARREPVTEENMALLQVLAARLGVPEDEKKVTGTIDALVEAGKTNAQLRKDVTVELKLREDAPLEDVVAALKARGSAPDPAKYVPMEVYRETLAALKDTQDGQELDRVAALVREGRESGKLTEAMESWAKGYAAQDPEGFAAWLKAAPVIVARKGAGQRPTGSVGGTGTRALDDEEKAVCKALGLTEAQWLKHNAD